MKNNNKSLVIWADADCDSEIFLSPLRAAGDAVDVRILTDSSQAIAYLKETDDPRLLLIYSSPVLALCRTMARGETPEDALRAWRDGVMDQLRVLRRYRGNVIAVDLLQIALYPKAFLDAIGISVDETLAASVLPVDPVLELFAATAIAQDVTARSINEELSVSGIDLSAGEVAPNLALDAIFQQYRSLIQKTEAIEVQQEGAKLLVGQIELLQNVIESQEVKHKRALSELNVEKENIQNVLKAKQKEMEGYFGQLQVEKSAVVKLEQANKELSDNMASLNLSNKAIADQFSIAKIENERLSLVLSELNAEKENIQNVLKSKQKEMEGYFGQLQIAKSKISRLEEGKKEIIDQLSLLKIENERLANALSQVEKVKNKTIAGFNAEKNLLRNQLVHMQAEVNRYYRELSEQIDLNRKQRDEYEKRLWQVNQGMESYQAQIGEAESNKVFLLEQIQSLHDIRSELESYYAASQDLEVKLSRIQNSWSYRMTSPLRWLRKALSKGVE